MKKIIVLIGLVTFAISMFAQHSGNSVMGRNTYNNKKQTNTLLYLSDSTFVIEARVLQNVIADSYVVTFGVAEYSETLNDANMKIDKRINDFISSLNAIGVSKTNIYVDITTQTQVLDYKINGAYAEQFLNGFEQKKNVIIKLESISNLNNIVILASQFSIYDLVSVDYVVTDINKIYNQLFAEAVNTIKNKKELYVNATNMKLLPASQIYNEDFFSIDPSQLYQNYTPNTSSLFTNYNYQQKKKDLRPNTTFYYKRGDYSGFDKVINPVVSEPAIEYGLTLTLKFEIE